MDEVELAAALRRATDGVVVPRDLVRRAERDGRERRARRRSAAGALAVTAVVLTGGALLLQQGGASESASDGTDAPGPAASAAGCLPALTVDGVPAGRTVPVRAGASVEVVGATPCGPSGERYLIALDAAGTPPAVIAEVAPAPDGSFSVRVAIPAATPVGSAVLLARGAEERTCPSAAGCPGAVDLEVLAGPPPDRSTEEPP